MNRLHFRGRPLLLLILVFGLGAGASGQATEIDLRGHRYVGVLKCSGCHKKILLGNQAKVWRKGPHAQAYETLRNEESQAIAARLGLKKAAHEAPECLRCHVTAYGRPTSDFAYGIKPSDGVQCESCHGPGRDYRKKKIMSDPELAHRKGLWDSDDATICTQCHNSESPTFDPKRFTLPDGTTSAFDFDVARKQIPHPIPPDTKGHYLEIEKRLKAQGKKVK